MGKGWVVLMGKGRAFLMGNLDKTRVEVEVGAEVEVEVEMENAKESLLRAMMGVSRGDGNR